MTTFTRLRLHTKTRSVQFLRDHPVRNPLAERLTSHLTLHIEKIHAFAIDQDGAHGAMLAWARARQEAAELLREEMRTMARVAKVLDPAQHPGVASKLRTADLKVHQELLSRARVFVATGQEIPDTFIAYGCPADFLDRLETLITRVEKSFEEKIRAHAAWVSATKALLFETRRGIATLRKLEVIVGNCLRKDPVLSLAWRAATRIERARKSRKTLSPTPTETTTSATPIAATPPPLPVASIKIACAPAEPLIEDHPAHHHPEVFAPRPQTLAPSHRAPKEDRISIHEFRTRCRIRRIPSPLPLVQAAANKA